MTQLLTGKHKVSFDASLGILGQEHQQEFNHKIAIVTN